MHHRIQTIVRGLFAALAIFALASCSDEGAITRSELPQGPAARNLSTLPKANFRRVVDSVTNTLIAKNSDRYDVPGAGALDTMVMAVDSVLAGRVGGADAMLDKYAYDVYSMRESVTNDSLVVIRERKASGSTEVARGWGLYVFNPTAQNRADVHVNHPVDDQHSEDIAGDLYRSCRCRWFLMAGARRATNVGQDTISDMARHQATVFNRIHVRVAAANARAVSVHGFDAANYASLPAGVDQVLALGRSSATTTPTFLPADTVLRRRLVNAGFVSGLHGLDSAYTVLGATHNPQGRHSNDVLGWGRWIHIEHERALRDDSVSWKQSNGVIRQWIIDHPAQ